MLLQTQESGRKLAAHANMMDKRNFSIEIPARQAFKREQNTR
jgi:hypothetical protein